MRAGSAVGVALLSLALATTAFAATPPDETAAVLVQGFSFQPPAVSIVAGGSVTWTVGTDPEQHTVTPREPGAFEGSGQLFTGDAFTVTFEQPGMIEYFCSLHPTMVGTVEVAAPAATTTPAALPTASPRSSPGDGEPAPSGEPAAGPTLLIVAVALGLGLFGLLALVARRRT
jgi:plastocyanin